MDKIRIGQIGIGHNHGSEKMRTARKFPDVFEVVGIAEPSEEWRADRGMLDAYQGLKWMSVDDLLSVDRLDAILVETDVWNLVPTAQKCIDAGVHIHLDKPGGEDIREYERVLMDAKAKNLTVQLGYMYRYNPAVQYCYSAVRDGMLGEVFEVDAMMSTEHPWGFREWLRHFRGGSMFIFGCHLIDLIISLLGRPQRIVPFLKKTHFDGIDVYDNGLAVLEYEKGTSTVRTTSVEVNGYGRRHFTVCGSKGTIEIKPFENPTVMTLALNTFTKTYEDCRKVIDLPTIEGRYDEQILDFARMVRGEKENPFTLEHELLVQRATLRACGYEIDL